MKKIKAYFTFLLTGWYSVEFLGNPKRISGTYIVCLKNKEVMEFNYSNFGGDARWYKLAIGDADIDNPIIFWKQLPKPPRI